MPRRAILRRAAVVTAVTAVAFVSSSLSATATDDIESTSAVVTNSAIYPDANEPGDSVDLEGRGSLTTKLIGLRTDDGAVLKTYCVEISTPVDPDAIMDEREWDDHPNPDTLFHQNRANILWILQNSYPVLGVEELAAAAEVPDAGAFTVEQAIGATQAAIWHYSDAAVLDGGDPNVLAVYAYLTGNANVGVENLPVPALSITPPALTGVAGDSIGPFVVSTTADSLDLRTYISKKHEDSVVVRTDDVIHDGSEMFVDVSVEATPGDAAFEVYGEVTIDVGRLFIGSDYEAQPTQSLILASSERTEIGVTAEARWQAAPVQETPTPTPTPEESPAPTPEVSDTPTPTPSETPGTPLPDTGSGASPAGLAGVALMLIGGTALVLTRRRSPEES